MTLSAAFLDEVRARTTLSGLVGRGVKLSRAGREHKGCCPFHHEKTPSFTVNDEKGFYHCFGCGAHGDAIRWLTDHEGMGFVEAVAHLADAAGLAMPARSPEAAAKARQIDALRPALDAAQGGYLAALASDDGAAARSWLAARGVNEAVAGEFALGWARPGGTLRGLGIGEKAAAGAGLVSAGVDGQGLFERFRARVTIPIQDARGRLCGFGGALIEKRDGWAKYINSPEGPLFDKGRLLFNLHRAAPRVRPRADGGGLLPLLIVEGFFDAIACHAAGWPVVAPLGTALTEAQLERAWRVHPCPVLLFDGDKAGASAAMRAASRAMPMLGPGRSLRFGILPEGQDPDDLIRAQGAGAIDALVDGAADLFEFVAARVLGEISGGNCSPEAAAGAWDVLAELANSVAHDDTKALYWAGWRKRWEAVAGLRVQLAAVESDDARARDAGLIVDGVAEIGGDMRLLAIVMTIERLMDDRKGISDDIRDRLAVAKAMGFDPAVIRRVIAERAMDAEKRQEREALHALYRRELGIEGPMTEALLPPPFNPGTDRLAARRTQRLGHISGLIAAAQRVEGNAA